MAKHPSVYAVIPVFNGKDHTDKFLDSFSRQDYKNLKIVIVDDGSTDGTAEMIRGKYPQVIVLTGSGDLWWSGATNLGVRQAVQENADYILTINNDVTVADDYVSSLVAVSLENPNSLVGSMVVYDSAPKKVWYVGARLDRRRGEMQHVHGIVGDFKKPHYTTEWLTGMGVLIPAGAFSKAGLYDEENFPQYFGDADFSIRAKHAGYALLVSTQAVVSADVESAWVQKQLAKPNWQMLYDLLFSIRSPYKIKTRVHFFRLHWGKGWRGIALKFYLWTLKGMYVKFLLAMFGVQISRDKSRPHSSTSS